MKYYLYEKEDGSQYYVKALKINPSLKILHESEKEFEIDKSKLGGYTENLEVDEEKLNKYLNSIKPKLSGKELSEFVRGLFSNGDLNVYLKLAEKTNTYLDAISLRKEINKDDYKLIHDKLIPLVENILDSDDINGLKMYLNEFLKSYNMEV